VNPRKIREIGISTLDTRDMSLQPSELGSVLQTQNMNWGEGGSKRWSFLFGETKRIFPSEMRECLERSIRKTDAGGRPCKVVVVGHAIGNDLQAMKLIGVDLFDREQFPDILGILDTFKIATYLHSCQKLDSTKGFRLKHLLECLQIPFKLTLKTNVPALSAVHLAGNDANFTLKALLAMAVLNSQRQVLITAQLSMLSKLQSIAHTPLRPGPTANLERYKARILARKAGFRAVMKAIKETAAEDWYENID